MPSPSRTGSRGRPPNRLPLPAWIDAHFPWVVLGGALLFTAAVAAFVMKSAHERDHARFENAVQSARDRIERRLDVYLASLNAGAALFAVRDTVTAEEFRDFVEHLHVQRRYPGIQGIGWSRRVRPGRPDGSGEEHAIRFLEPLDARNLAAIGYDMYGEAVRREAMARARDQAEAALSGKVRLVQEIFGPEQAGFLLYVPVYSTGYAPPDVAERRRDLEGFVYGPFRADDLFSGVFGSEQHPRVSFRVYDGTDTVAEALLHESPVPPGHHPAFTVSRPLTVAGRPWTVVFASTPEFERAVGLLPWAVIVSGLIASLWLFSLARAQTQARRAAEEANVAKSAFLATMSHELRTPLNAIAGYADLLDLEIPGPLSDRQRAFVDRIRSAQQHLLGLINDVLNFAKLEAGHVRIRTRPVDVQDVVTDAESLIEAQILGRGLDYSQDGGPPAMVLADPEKARQILLNLLSNAAKFTEPGGRVSVRWNRGDSAVRIAVVDTGPGIPAEKLESIFDPFVQVDADLTRTGHGTGLGLSISRELARGMGGDLKVDSVPGVGSTFTLTLPSAARPPVPA